MKPKKPLKLEQSGLLIELFDEKRVFITYSACTHGGWAKYLGDTDKQIGFFETKGEIIADAYKIAKFYNLSMEVSV